MRSKCERDKEWMLYQKFSLGYLHRTCCFIGFFFVSLLICIESQPARHTHIFRARHINKLWISKWRQWFISSAQRDRCHIHYSLCIPSDQEVKCQTLAIVWNTCYWQREKWGKKLDNLWKNWYWKVFSFFLLLRCDNESWLSLERKCFMLVANNMWFQNWFTFLIWFFCWSFVSAQFRWRWADDDVTADDERKKSIENIYSNKCTYIEHTVEQCACNCSSYEKKSATTTTTKLNK